MISKLPILLVVFILISQASCGQVYLDGGSGKDASSCGSKSSPCESIQYALDQIASSGDTLYLSDTFRINTSVSVNTYIAEIPEGWTIGFVGGWKNPAVLDGENKHKGISHDYVSNCQFANGSRTSNTNTADIYIEDIHFNECVTKSSTRNCGPSIRAYGGAVYVQRSLNGNINVEIQDCQFTGCSAQVNGFGSSGGDIATGGAVNIYGRNSGRVVINDCYFTNNWATYSRNGAQGGAVLINTIGYAEITNSTFCDNYVEGSNADNGDLGRKRNAGAAIGYVDLRTNSTGNNMLVDGCVFVGNEAKVSQTFVNESGGAVYLNCADNVSTTTATLNLKNSLFYKNINEKQAAHFGTRGGTLNTSNVPISQSAELFTDSIPEVVCKGDSIEAKYLLFADYYWNGVPGRKTQVDKSGDYILSINLGNCGTITDTVSIKVLWDSLEINDSSICAGNSKTFWAGKFDSLTHYYWEYGNGQKDTGHTISAKFSSSGSHVIQLIQSAKGYTCRDTLFDSVSTFPRIAGYINTDTLCPFDTAQLFPYNLSYTNGLTYTWLIDSQIIGNDSLESYVFQKSGIFKVELEIQNKGCSNTIVDSFMVLQVPSLKTFGDTSICKNTTVPVGVHGQSPSYKWFNGKTDSIWNFTPDSSGVYWVSATNKVNGCANFDSIHIQVRDLPQISILANDSFCSNDSVTLRAQKQDASHQLSWSTGDTTFIISFKINEDSNVWLIATDSNGCASLPDSHELKLYNVSQINIQGDTSVCAGQNVVLTASNATKFSWNLTGSISKQITLSYTPSTDSVVTVIANGSDRNGCKADPDTVNLFVDVPVLSIKTDSLVCLGDTVSLQLNGGADYWMNGKPVAANSVMPIDSNMKLFVEMETANGCKVSDSFTIKAQNPPTFQISAKDSTCINDTITISTSKAFQHFWNTGSTQSQFRWPISQNTLIYGYAIDSFGCRSTVDTHNIYIKPTEKLEIIGNSQLCTGQQATYKVNKQGVFNWNLSGSNSNIISLRFNLSQNDQKSLIVKGVDTLGCPYLADSLVINIIGVAEPIVNGPDTACMGDTINFQATGTNSETIVWPSGIGIKYDHIVDKSEIIEVYSIKGNCKSDIVEKWVYLDAEPILSFQYPPKVCKGETAKIKMEGATAQKWKNGAKSEQIEWVFQTSEWISYTTYTKKGCVMPTDSLLIEVADSPTVLVPNADSICLGDTLTLIAHSNHSHQWIESQSFADTQSIVLSKDSQFSIVPFLGTCFGDTQQIALNTFSPLQLVISGKDTLCTYEQLQLTSNIHSSLIWEVADSILSADTLRWNVQSNGLVISAKGIDQNGCVTTTDSIVIIVDSSNAKMRLRTKGTAPGYVNFFNMSPKSAGSKWLLNDSLLDDSSQHVFMKLLDTGWYKIQLINTSEYSCLDTSVAMNFHLSPFIKIPYYTNSYDTIMIPENPILYEGPLLLPTAFTPNGDGVNDKFVLNGDYRYIRGMIFSFSGTKIYHWEGADWWDGSFKGQTVPIGNYLYIIEYLPKEAQKMEKATGVIMIIR